MLAPERKAMLPADGPLRVIGPDAVADAVWEASTGTGRHRYIPAGLASLAAQPARAPEQARDDRLAGKIG